VVDNAAVTSTGTTRWNGVHSKEGKMHLHGGSSVATVGIKPFHAKPGQKTKPKLRNEANMTKTSIWLRRLTQGAIGLIQRKPSNAQDGQRLIIESTPPRSLLAMLATLQTRKEEFPAISDSPAEPVDI
jgi:hypothetical protein